MILRRLGVGLVLLAAVFGGFLPTGFSPDSYGSGYLWAYSTAILRPNAAGAMTQLGANGAASNWDCVDEASADGLSTYVNKYGSGYYYDLYDLTDFPASGTIQSITLHFRAYYSGQAGWAFPYLRTGSTNYSGAEKTLTSSFADYSHTWTTNPATSAAWQIADLNSLQAGVGLYGHHASDARCTQVYVEVTYTPADEVTIVLRPNAAGSLANLTPHGSSTNWKNMADGVERDAATYNSKVGSGYVTDLYSFPDISYDATVASVTVKMRCDVEQNYKDGQNPAEGWAMAALRVGGTDYYSDEKTLNWNWADYSYTWTVNPQTSSAWTISDINALQAGVALYGQYNYSTARCTLVELDVVLVTESSFIHVNSPGPGAFFQGGLMTIQWAAHAASGTYRVELWNADTLSYEAVIAASGSSYDGEYDWTIPAAVSGNKFVKVIDANNESIVGSSGTFSLAAPAIDTYVFALDLLGAYGSSGGYATLDEYRTFLTACRNSGARGVRFGTMSWFNRGHQQPYSPFPQNGNGLYLLDQWNSSYWDRLTDILEIFRDLGLEAWITVEDWFSGPKWAYDQEGDEVHSPFGINQSANPYADEPWYSANKYDYHEALVSHVISVASGVTGLSFLIEPMNENGEEDDAELHDQFLGWISNFVSYLNSNHPSVTIAHSGDFLDHIKANIDVFSQHGVYLTSLIVPVNGIVNGKVLFSSDGGNTTNPASCGGYLGRDYNKYGYLRYGICEADAAGMGASIAAGGYVGFEFMDRGAYMYDRNRLRLMDYNFCPLYRMNLGY